MSLRKKTGAGGPGARFSSLALFFFLALSFTLPRPSMASGVNGQEGQVRVAAGPGVAVSFEQRPGQSVWLVSGLQDVAVPDHLRRFVTAEGPNKLAVILPEKQQPSMAWSGGELLFRWLPGGEGDVFGSFTPPAYPLGSGDKLQITVYNVEDMNQTVIVDPKGFITFPVLDKVSVAGLTVNELQHKLEGLLAQFVKEPQVNAQLIEYGSRFVNVMGEVQTPGRLPIKGALRLLDSISQAGGFTEKSGDVELQRRDSSGQLQSKVFSRDELLGNDNRTNIYVLDQDVINVQPMKQVYVSGEVKNPGSLFYYKDLTLLRAVAKQGGFTQWAKKDKVDILRDNGKGGTETIRVDARKIEKGEIDDVPLMPNDHVVVNERKFL